MLQSILCFVFSVSLNPKYFSKKAELGLKIHKSFRGEGQVSDLSSGSVGVRYLLVSSLQLHVFELPEAAHRFHLLQVPVEGQAAQTEAVAAVADGLQPLHLFHYGGHGDGRRHRRRRGSARLLSRNRLFAQSILV